MSEPSLAAQQVLIRHIRATAAIADLVPPNNIFDKNARPERFPCIIIGDGQTVNDDAECIMASEVYLTADVYVRENGLATCKIIAGAIRRAMRNVSEVESEITLHFFHEDSVFLRDPDGITSHAAVNFRILAEEPL